MLNFSWYLKNLDRKLITPISAEFIPAENPIPGRGGVAIWTFKINHAAFAIPTLLDISLIYAQAWKIHDSTEAHYTIITNPEGYR